MNSLSKNRPLTGCTVLIAPSVTGELATELERHGARVLTWPRLAIQHVDNCTPLDEAIENLFGYDWLIFRNVNAVDFFLRRFRELGRDISELDTLRVCAIGEPSNARLEEFQVHVDVIPNRLSSAAALSALEGYVGGRDSFGGLNFLIPRAGSGSDSLTQALADAGARVDEVTTYRTCAPANGALAQIKGLLTGGGIDSVIFAASAEVREFATVFDTNDLAVLLGGVVVACDHETTAQAAADFGVRVNITTSESTSLALARAVSEDRGMTGQ